VQGAIDHFAANLYSLPSTSSSAAAAALPAPTLFSFQANSSSDYLFPDEKSCVLLLHYSCVQVMSSAWRAVIAV
jgi:hypothetical protein